MLNSTLAAMSFYRQQAQSLRRHQPQGRGHCTTWTDHRSRSRAAEENRSAGQVRVNRTDPRGSRRLHQGDRQETWGIPICKLSQPRTLHDNPTMCETGVRMDCKYRIGPKVVRHPLAAPNQSDPDLPPNWQSAVQAASGKKHNFGAPVTSEPPTSSDDFHRCGFGDGR